MMRLRVFSAFIVVCSVSWSAAPPSREPALHVWERTGRGVAPADEHNADLLVINCHQNTKRYEDEVAPLKTIYHKVYTLHLDQKDSEAVMIEKIARVAVRFKRVAVFCHGGPRGDDYVIGDHDGQKNFFLVSMKKLWEKLDPILGRKERPLLLLNTCHAGLIDRVNSSRSECSRANGAVCAACPGDCSVAGYTMPNSLRDAYRKCSEVDANSDGKVTVGELEAWFKKQTEARSAARRPAERARAEYRAKRLANDLTNMRAKLARLRLNVNRMDLKNDDVKAWVNVQYRWIEGLIVAHERSDRPYDKLLDYVERRLTGENDELAEINRVQTRRDTVKAGPHTDANIKSREEWIERMRKYTDDLDSALGLNRRRTPEIEKRQETLRVARELFDVVGDFHLTISSGESMRLLEADLATIYPGCPLVYGSRASKDNVVFTCPAPKKD